MLEPYDLFQARETVLKALNDALTTAGLVEPRTLQRLEPARPGLQQAAEELERGDCFHPAYRIANPAITLANDVYFRSDPARAASLLRLSVRLFDSISGKGDYTKSLDFCRARLAALGDVAPEPEPIQAVIPSTTGIPGIPGIPGATAAPATDADGAPPVAPTIPAQVTEAVLRAPDAMSAGAAAGALVPEAAPGEPTSSATPNAPTVTATATSAMSAAAAPSAPASSAPSLSPAPSATSDPLSPDTNERYSSSGLSWPRLLKDWHTEGGDLSVEELIDRFQEDMEARLQSAPGAAKLLLPILREDFAALRSEFEGLLYPGLAPRSIRMRAVNARRCCLTEQTSGADLVAASETAEVRTRWLASATWNFALQQVWKTNLHQVVTDILGYLSALQIQTRYNPDEREVLLAATELIPLLTLDLRDTELQQVQFVHQWLRHSVGTHLLVGGPEPAMPEDSKFDPRVQDPNAPNRHLGRENWAVHLLTKWATDKEQDKRTSVALALLILSGWNADRVDRMLTILFHNPYAAGPTVAETQRVKEVWQAEVTQMLATTRTVHVAKNPWVVGSSVSNSLSTSERDASVQLPDRVLKAVTGELFHDQPSTVLNGAPFRDSRVPTFLCHNEDGAFGVLKIDAISRVQREKHNWDKYAKKLHGSYRASECLVGTSVVTNSSSGEGYQGIRTSYVFRRRDVPKTLTGWLRERKVEDPGPVLEELFVEALRPWLSNARRRVGDLRTEYPVLRPSSFERTTFGPDRHAGTELASFRLPEVAETFGVPDGLDWRHPTLAPLLEGSALGAGALAEAFDYAPRTNPLWLAAQVGEVPADDGETPALVDSLLHHPDYGLATTSYLSCTSHGDLHGDNVLISGADPTRPQLHVIDFETTHTGHVCKDFARLESALWSRVFTWQPEQLKGLRTWFVEALAGPSLWDPKVPADVDPEVRSTLLAVRKLRTILKKCEQPLWPMHASEYQWALFASLLPFARYPDSDAPDNRFLAFLFAADVAEALTAWGKESA